MTDRPVTIKELTLGGRRLVAVGTSSAGPATSASEDAMGRLLIYTVSRTDDGNLDLQLAFSHLYNGPVSQIGTMSGGNLLLHTAGNKLFVSVRRP